MINLEGVCQATCCPIRVVYIVCIIMAFLINFPIGDPYLVDMLVWENVDEFCKCLEHRYIQTARQDT